MTTTELVEKITLDAPMQETITKCTTPAEAYDYAKGQGLTDTMEQFVKTMGELKKASTQMTEADVDTVTGGSDDSILISTLTTASTASIVFASTISAACGA